MNKFHLLEDDSVVVSNTIKNRNVNCKHPQRVSELVYLILLDNKSVVEDNSAVENVSGVVPKAACVQFY